MRILLAGGTGVLGSRLIPRLRAAGHDVFATTRRSESMDFLEGLGAHALQADVYDRDRLALIVAEAAPELLLCMLTDLADADFAANARLRKEGVPNLVEAALQAKVPRMIAQSIAWIFPDGTDPATEEDSPATQATGSATQGSLDAVAQMEAAVRRMPRATLLRYGTLYGPGTFYEREGRIAAQLRAGALAADGAISNFLHADDAAEATVQSLTWPDGVYHLADGDPAQARDWVPAFAKELGVGEPQQVEGPAIGRAINNAKSRAQGWMPAHASWRAGFF